MFSVVLGMYKVLWKCLGGERERERAHKRTLRSHISLLLRLNS